MPSLLKAKGLFTYYNELSTVPDGALVQADNVIIDRKAIVEPRRGFALYGDTFPLSTDRAKQLLNYKDRILRHFGSTLQFDDGSGTFTSFAGTYNELETGLRIKAQEQNSNLYFTTSDGIKKISASSASDFTASSGFIRPAGGPAALDLTATLKTTTGGFLPAKSKVAYRVVWGIKDANGILVLGSPSERAVVTNTSEDIKSAEVFTVDFTGATETGVSAADQYILINSANINYFFWFSSTAGITTAPQTSETLARTGIEVDVDGLTTDDAAIANRFANSIAALNTLFDVELTSSTVVQITSKESGTNLVDASESSTPIPGVSITINEQGNTTTGTSATVDLTFSVPQEVDTTNFFYQVYRTSNVTADETTSLDSIDPGDEMNQVFESGITSAEITAGEVTVSDIAPNDFRDANAFLYTNPVSGQGILQANEPPPVAKDVALFRNSMFYANTKTVHKETVTLLGLSDFVSGTSDIIIGNSTAKRVYRFIGAAEVTPVTCDSRTNTTTGGYILLNSARDERKYYVWFDKTGSDTDPAVADRIGVRVNISSSLDTAAGTSAALTTALNSLDDFSVVDGTGSVTITNIKNGNTTDATIGAALGGAWAIGSITQGDGEDADTATGGDVLLSSLVSAGQSVDETARSLVKIINKDSQGIVYAFYLSGPDDLPGIILLKSRALTDDQFVIGTSHSAIVARFNPEIAAEQSSTVTISNPGNFNTVGHGLSTGDKVYITDEGVVVPTIENNTYTITKIDNDNFTIPVDVTTGGTATWFKTDVTSDNEVAQNRIYFSKVQQPDAVPIVNFIDVGPKDKPIRRIVALRDNLFVLKDDGVYILTGNIAPDFTVRLLDNSVTVLAPDSAATINNQIMMLSEDGVAAISDTGISIISRPIEDKILDVTGSGFSFSTATFGVGYENDRAYLLWLPTLKSDTVATQCYRYNTFTRTWTRWTKSNTCGVVSSGDSKLYLGAGDTNAIEQERKNLERQDYADREFDLSFVEDGITGTSLIVSDITNISVGDAIVQTQYVTISKFNRLLKKLDLDQGLDDTDYFSTLALSQGDNLPTAITNFVTKLNVDDFGATHTYSGATDFATIRDEMNTIIDTLNGGSTDAIFGDYTRFETAISYESLVLTTNTLINTITVNLETPILEGEFTSYQHIESIIQYAPQDFGEPSMQKQVSEGTLIFDANNFYSGEVSYNTDLSRNFEKIPFIANSNGDWGSIGYGNSTWGGEGTDVPLRTLIPRQKQRCRYISCKFRHANARNKFNLLGLSLKPRAISTKAYRGING